MRRNKQPIEFDEMKAAIVEKLAASSPLTVRIMEQRKLEKATCYDELLPVMRLNRAWMELNKLWKLINQVPAEALERNKMNTPFTLEEYREYAKEDNAGF